MTLVISDHIGAYSFAYVAVVRRWGTVSVRLTLVSFEIMFRRIRDTANVAGHFFSRMNLIKMLPQPLVAKEDLSACKTKVGYVKIG